MSFKVENMEEKNMVKLVIEATAEEFEAGLNTAFNKNKNKISVPGFRKGKAPRKMVEKLYGTEIFYEDAANAIIPDAYAKAADESELEIVSQPKINVVQIEAGKPFIFEAVVAVKPEVELGQYKIPGASPPLVRMPILCAPAINNFTLSEWFFLWL